MFCILFITNVALSFDILTFLNGIVINLYRIIFLINLYTTHLYADDGYTFLRSFHSELLY